MKNATLEEILASIRTLPREEQIALLEMFSAGESDREGDATCEQVEVCRARLAVQKELTRQYFDLLANTERNEDAERQVADWASRIQEQLQRLSVSWPWKVCAFVENGLAALGVRDRAGSPVLLLGVVHEELQSVNAQPKKRLDAAPCLQQTHHALTAMERVHAEASAVLASRRWRLGNALGVMTDILRIGPRPPRPEHRLQQTLDAFARWSATRDNSPTEADMVRLREMLRTLHGDVTELVMSPRWRMGNAVGRWIDVLTRQPRRQLAVDRLQEILQYYAECDAPSS